GDLRSTFDKKAFLMRQAALVGFMRGDGYSDEFLARLSGADLAAVAQRAGGELATLARGYLAKRRDIGLGLAGDDRAITTAEGGAIEAPGLPAHLRDAGKVTMSAQANGEMCRILMSARGSGGPCAAHGQVFQSEKGNS
ncbi:MAG TPA: hypothetical protein VL101_10620, partial [Nordella sp.]|nr:hypothetical protein [Nordella sp.]